MSDMTLEERIPDAEVRAVFVRMAWTLSGVAAICGDLEREARDDPNGGFGPGMEAAVRAVREVLFDDNTPPNLVVITAEEAKRAQSWFVRLPLGATAEDYALSRHLGESS